MSYGPLLDRLIEVGKVAPQQIDKASATAPAAPEKVLVEQGLVSTDELLETLTAIYGVPAVSILSEAIDPEMVDLLPPDMAVSSRVLPLRRSDGKLVLGMEDPSDLVTEDFVRFVTGFEIMRVAVLRHEVDQVLKQRRGPDSEALSELKSLAIGVAAPDGADVLDGLPTDEGTPEEQKKLSEEEEKAKSQPVIRAVQSILVEAVNQKASDIHLEPVETGLRVRYRIDGSLREIVELPRLVQPMVVSRIKLTSGIDISEKRRPQDGRMRIQVGPRQIDFRVSTLPTFYGEKVVMRILDKQKAQPRIEDMGMAERDLASFLDFIRMPQGMILITGPTGSGKTSTLYAALSRIHTPETNIITVEDPVEFQISGINQVQVNNKAGLTFANALRSILRQDPNVVMLGEIRDLETATIAFEAAMTGHLVLSTLHTNDAPSAISRLLHLGVPNYLVASSLLGIVAQRLVRRMCQSCGEQTPLSQESQDILKRSSIANIPTTFYEPRGCKDCKNGGYSGRFGIFEVLRVTDQIKACVYASQSENEIRDVARRQGMNTLLEDGLLKCEQGLTSLDEVLKVAPAGTEVDNAEDGSQEAADSHPPLSEAAPQPHQPATGRRGRILLVDDEAAILKYVSSVLKGELFEVQSADDPKAGLEMAISSPPDLIILDMNMPGMNGLALCRKLRANRLTREIPIIFLTGEEDVQSEDAGLGAGADDYITKPVNPTRLVARVEAVLRRSQQHG